MPLQNVNLEKENVSWMQKVTKATEKLHLQMSEDNLSLQKLRAKD